MKTILVSDITCIITILECPTFFKQGMTNNVRLTFSVGDTTLWCTISIEQDN